MGDGASALERPVEVVLSAASPLLEAVALSAAGAMSRLLATGVLSGAAAGAGLSVVPLVESLMG